MQFIIDQPLPADFRSTFVVVAHFMHGDADHYSTEEWEFSTTTDMNPVAEFLTALDAQGGGWRRLGKCAWKTLRGSWAMDHSQDIPDGHTKAALVTWPMDLVCTDTGGAPVCAKLESWSIVWYDDNGRAFNVRVAP